MFGRRCITMLLALLLPAIASLGLTGAASASPRYGSADASTTSTVTVNGPSAKMTVKSAGATARRTFTGKVGEVICVVITDPNMSDNGNDTLTLRGPDGVVDSNEAPGNGYPNGIGPDELTQNGTYTVLYQLDNTATGTARLWVSAPVSVGTIVVNGSSASMNVTRVGQEVERTFKGTAGQHVTSTVSDIVNTDNGNDWITLIGPSGAVVDSNEASGNGYPNTIGPDKLPSTGTYTVLYRVDNTATGTGRLTVTT
jgi:hypothetical protein